MAFAPPRGIFLSLIGPLLWLSTGCGRRAEPHHEPEPSNAQEELQLTSPQEKRWWIQKAVRALRNGDGALDDAETARLQGLSEPQVVDELLASPRFADTVVDFGLYWLGIKSDKLGYPDGKDPFASFTGSVLSVPQAFYGARLVLDGGDVLGLFTEKAPLVAEPLSPVFDFETMKFAEDSRGDRHAMYEKVEAAFGRLEALVAVGGPIPFNEYCRATREIREFASGDNGIPFDFIRAFFSKDALKVYSPCFSSEGKDDSGAPPPPIELAAEVPAIITALHEKARKMIAYLDELEPDVYTPHDFASIKLLDLPRMGLAPDEGPKPLSWLFRLVPNSSTNADRKRANYVLKRFFCDDLTPINVVLPESHAEGKHAADPACQSCHYKLDPMAGFFRTRGNSGIDFAGKETITFDDFADKPLSEYEEAWKNTSGDAAHPWNVGFVRSSTDATLTDWGDHPENPTLDDLFGVIQRAPEVKRCLVRRMFQYFVAEGQTMDAGWLDHLASRYTETAQTSPAAAFKDTVKALVTSNTFKASDPASEQCYDFAPGASAVGKPPCKVAYILEKNCASCHTGAGAQGGLDLTKWGKTQDGEVGFEGAKPGALQAIVDRLSVADPALRMPLARHMDEGERDALYRWATEEAKK